jgi:chorismate dehydratase
MLERCDAALVIGDEALYSARDCQVVRDLGADWRELTGQHFVWAFWAGREDALTFSDVETLLRSLHEGLLNTRRIAAKHSSPIPGSEDSAELNEAYLREHMRYSLGEEELIGLKLFYIKAWEHGLIDGVPRLRFYEN